ncbi:lipocalin family protein [Candidatus Bacteroides intestinigallinarum]|jgi:hypothetical protein|uniref:lipocalin family protein n=1 Tax=Bacteroides TaxID=816 RepID=UPI000E857CEA|nr:MULTISPECIES: lipocalin family protein [Bacteroides]MCS3176373.1 lipocalin family protein [Candidatus Bacteroides intestinigallinarum]RGN64609.1 hypothetical protein DXB58_05595 [Bacteroides sp. OM05-10AA]RGQ67495.1 hypothetical protein DWY87_07235 [Bacteroides sp. AF27-33]
MKTFRFFATLLVITLCAGFTSCSDNDDEKDNNNSPLVGTWMMTKSIKDGHTRIPGQNGFDGGLGIVFSADGTFYNLVENERVEGGNYSYDEKNSTLTLAYTGDETLFCSVKTFSAISLVISYTEGPSSTREDYFVKQ